MPTIVRLMAGAGMSFAAVCTADRRPLLRDDGRRTSFLVVVIATLLAGIGASPAGARPAADPAVTGSG